MKWISNGRARPGAAVAVMLLGSFISWAPAEYNPLGFKVYCWHWLVDFQSIRRPIPFQRNSQGWVNLWPTLDRLSTVAACAA